MIEKTYTPYTYLIGWTQQNKWYYGSRTAKKYKCLYETGCHPDDLFVTYFTSSFEVLEMIKIFGQPDVIKIRKTFPDNPQKALYWEGNVIKKLRLPLKLNWLNKGYLNTVPNSWINQTKEERKKHGQNIAKSQIQKGVHNFLKINRKGKMGNEFTQESAKEIAIKRMNDGTNYFCKLCCVDEYGNIVWLEKEVFYDQKHTNKLVMNSSKEGKRRIQEAKK